MPQTKAKSPNGVAGFLFTPQWAWIAYPAVDLVGDDLGDDEAFHGFAVEVLTNLSGYQARAHDLAVRSYAAATAAGVEKKDGNAIDAAEDAYLATIAWRCRAWNWQEQNADGDVVAVPAPGETEEAGAFQAFFVLPAALRTWTVRVIGQAALPKRTSLRSSPASSTAEPTLRSTPPPRVRPGS